MENFYTKLTKDSKFSDHFPQHQVGATVMYKGNDGIKYYAIVGRKEVPLDPASQRYYTNVQYNVYLELRLLSNPHLEVGMRKPTRTMSAGAVQVIETGSWLTVQEQFIKALRSATKEAVQYHK